MRPPIIVVDDDTMVFETVEAVERYLEPWSLESGNMRIYDRDGLPLVAQIARTQFLKNEAVILADRPGATPELDQLRPVLIDFLTTRGVDVSDDHQAFPLDRLWEMATKFHHSQRDEAAVVDGNPAMKGVSVLLFIIGVMFLGLSALGFLNAFVFRMHGPGGDLGVLAALVAIPCLFGARWARKRYRAQPSPHGSPQARAR